MHIVIIMQRYKSFTFIYFFREKDVNSAIQFLTKNNCLEDCSNFLRVDIKEQIVEVSIYIMIRELKTKVSATRD